jgi:hypothetical protein
MYMDKMIEEFKAKVCDDISVEPEGLNRFRIITPFSYGDGDHFVIYMKLVDGKNSILTDEGHTLMHLSYQDFKYWEGTRGRLLEDILSQFQINFVDGRLELRIPENMHGDALFSYIKAIQKITDMEFLSKERAKSTFMDDFRELLVDKIRNEERLEFDYIDIKNDPKGNYPVDASFFNSRVFHFYGINSDDKCRDATVYIRAFREWYPTKRPKPIGICEDQTELSRRVLARFTDVCHKTYSSLASADDDLTDFLIEEGALPR